MLIVGIWNRTPDTSEGFATASLRAMERSSKSDTAAMPDAINVLQAMIANAQFCRSHGPELEPIATK